MFDLVQTVRLGERIGFIPRELNKPPHDRPLLASDEPLDHIGKLLMPAKRCLRSKELSVGREKVGTYLPIAALKLSANLACQHASGLRSEEPRQLAKRCSLGMPYSLLRSERLEVLMKSLLEPWRIRWRDLGA